MNLKGFFFVLLFGIVFMGAGIYTGFISTKGYIETVGVIDHIDTHGSGDDTEHDVYVTYTVDGQTYTSLSNTYSSTYRTGKEVKIFYNPDQPDQIRGDAKFLGIIFIAAGALVILIPLGKLLIIGCLYKKYSK